MFLNDRPSFRYCPKCGSGDLVRPVGRKLVCRACDFVFYFNSAAAVAGLITDPAGRLLVVVRGREPGRGLLDLPGGFVDPGESAETALSREIREELGLVVRHLRYFGSEANEYPFRGVRYHTVDLAFHCEVDDPRGARAADDVAQIRWLELQDIDLDQVAFPATRALLARLRASSPPAPAS